MGRLTDYELSILQMMDGGPSVPWGAAMSAALEFMVGDGLVEQDGTNYWIADAGRLALSGHRQPSEDGR